MLTQITNRLQINPKTIVSVQDSTYLVVLNLEGGHTFSLKKSELTTTGLRALGLDA